ETLHCNTERALICLTYGFSVKDSRFGGDTPVAQTAGSRADSLWNHVAGVRGSRQDSVRGGGDQPVWQTRETNKRISRGDTDRLGASGGAYTARAGRLRTGSADWICHEGFTGPVGVAF